LKFTDEQKSIAMALLHGPKTLEELGKQLNIPSDTLMGQIKEMLQLELLRKDGFPTRYYLNESVSQGVLKRKELEEIDSNKIRLRITIEVQAVEEELLKKQLEDIMVALKKERAFLIYDSRIGEPVKMEEHYSSFIEANLSVNDFRSMVRLVLFYGPSAVEVVKPAKVEFNASEIQEGLVDMAEMVQNYTSYIAKLMSRKELEEFNAKFYEKEEKGENE